MPRDALPRSEAIKGEVIRVAGAWGFSHETERSIAGGKTRVDLVLTLGAFEIAVQISVTTPIALEVENLMRCLDAGFAEVVLLCDATVKREAIEARYIAEHGSDPRLSFSTVRRFQRRLEDIVREQKKAPRPDAGEPLKATAASEPLSKDEREKLVAEQLREIQERIRKAKGSREKSM